MLTHEDTLTAKEICWFDCLVTSHQDIKMQIGLGEGRHVWALL
jgi:hypothetical protein